ncbi:hypothetical protein GCM10023144_43820 [Pigmentiphaga soli]|uniref:HipA-like C-terminal domain-containing protein n=2 Tax=Pigmentiphaga soli TaxID=1007095 RepID=A0ABP8HPH0_9BURK
MKTLTGPKAMADPAWPTAWRYAAAAMTRHDRLAFQLTLLAYWIMAAIDGHAKNYSLFLLPGGSYTMTPLYDVLSFWPYVGARRGWLHQRDVTMAMALGSKNAHYRREESRPAIGTDLPTARAALMCGGPW